MDHQGNIVIPPSLDLNYTYGFSDGLCRFAVDDPATGMKKFGFLDKQGNIVIPAIYDSASDFGEGLALMEDSLLDDDFGYIIDHSGQLVMKMPTYEIQGYDGSTGQRPYNLSQSFSEGYAIVTAKGNDDIWHDYLMDKTGNVTPLNVPDGLRISGGVHSGLVRVVLDEGQDFHMGAIDLKGALVIPCMYDELDEFYDGIARAKLNGQDYIINTSNDAILCFGPDWDVNILENGAGMARCLVYPGGTYLLTAGGAAPATTPELTATPTTSTVLVNGVNTAFDAYNIGGANYFKLRDLAYVLNGTEKQFSVDWDGALNTIVINTAKGYTA